MGGQAQSQQPVFYDAEMGQYYTQTPTNNSPFAGVFNGNQLSAMNGGMGQQNSWLSSIFGRGGERTYLNNFGPSHFVKVNGRRFQTFFAKLNFLLEGLISGIFLALLR